MQKKTTGPYDLEILDKKAKLTVEYGDFSGPLSKTVAALKEAKKYAANEHQTAMLDGYIESYVNFLLCFQLSS